MDIRRLLGFIVLGLLLVQVAFSQTVVKHFTVDNGLPSTEIYFIHQDVEGYFWICTDRGISKYDGTSFTNYSTADGLTHNTIFKCFEDKNSNLWFTALDGTLTIYDRGESRFKAFAGNESLLKLYTQGRNWIHYIGFRNDSVFLLPLGHCYQKLYAFKNQKPTRIHLIDYDKSNSNCIKFDNISVIDNSDIMYRRYWKVLHLSEPSKSLGLSNFLGKYDDNIEIDNSFHQIKEQVFVCKTNGLFCLNKDRADIQYFSGHYVSSILLDKEGFYWVATVDNGVYVASNLAEVRKALEFPSNEKVTSVGALANHICLGTNLGSLHIYNQDKSFKKKITFSSKIRQVLQLYEYDSTLQYFDYSISYNKAGINKYPSLIVKLANSGTRFFSESINFVVPSEELLYEFPSLYELIYAGFIRQNHNAFSNFCIQKSNLYFTFKNTIAKLGKNDSMYQLIELDVLDKDAMVTSLDYYKEYLVVGTRGDGVLILKDDKMIAHFTQHEGLISDLINGCHVQKQNGRIWCATNEGVSVLQFNGENSEERFSLEGNLNQSDGLFSNYVVDIKEINDQIVCASSRGLTFFDSDYSIRINEPPIVSIVGFTQGDYIYHRGVNEFAYNQNNFEFHYNAVTNKPVKNRFRYRLVTDNVPGAWSLTDERSLRIENLPPGSHTFEVCARAQNTQWSEPVGNSFYISPRFIDKWWVRLLVLLALATLGYIVYKRRVDRIIGRNNLELAMQELELRNSKLESKALRGQMNPHFVFNVLNSIQKLILTEDKESANKLLNRFSKLIRSSLKYSRLEFIPIDQEVDFLTNYLNIETLRYPERFTFEIAVKDFLVEEEIKIPPLIIQPLCENAIKHAFKESGGRLFVTISKLDEYSLQVVVSDNGIGIENATKIHDSESLGLEIVRNRLDLFKDQGYKAEMKVASLNSELQTGTVIELILPYK